MKPPQNRLSVRTKIFGVTFTACAFIVVSMTLYFSRLGFATADRALENKASTYAHVLGREVESAVAFDDRETAREAFEAMTADPDVSGLAVYRENGRLLEARGEISARASDEAATSTQLRVPGGIIASAPVATREGPRGKVVVQMSTASVERQRRTLMMTALVASATALLASFIAAWTLARSIAWRLSRLSMSAGRLAAGNLSEPAFVDDGQDEIGQLAAAFASMVENVSTLMTERAATAADEQRRLEALVTARTTALAGRTRSMRMLLDNVSDGFAVIGLDGRLGSERSASFDRCFVGSGADAHIVEVLRSCDPGTAEWFDLAWVSLLEGVFPLEVCAAQFPPALRFGERTFSLAVTPIVGETGELTNALLVVHDATERLEHARAEAEQREVLGLLEVALNDRSAFLQFLADGNAIVARIFDEAYASDAEMKRDVHTLKGNAGLLGVTSVAACCHALESHLAEADAGSVSVARDDLQRRWTGATARLATVFAKTAVGRLDVDRSAFDSLVRAIDEGLPRPMLAHRARLLRLEPVIARLDRLAEQGTALVGRLEKQVEIVTGGDELYCDPSSWGPFWSALAHAMRNAIHHGIESAGERVSAGKSPIGRIELRAQAAGASFTVDVIDDGRGIDWRGLSERARTLGLEAGSSDELREALFADGVSTAAEVSDIAGRGVGLAALRAACTDLGGECRVMSAPGAGTTFRFAFPMSALGDAYCQHVDRAAQRAVA